MKPSLHKSISQEQLVKYINRSLTADEKKQIDRLLDDCELSKEALAGYAFVPSALADIPSLRRQIARRSRMRFPRRWTLNAVAGGTVLLIIACTGYFLLPKKGSPVVQKTQGVEVVQTNPGLPPAPSTVQLPAQPEHFVDPVVKNILTRKNTPVTKDSVDIHPLPPSSAEAIAPVTVQHADPQPVTPVRVQQHYNAPFIFILDLKVTDFEKYYGSTITVPDLPLTGTPAEFENDKSVVRNDGETVRQVPAENFLRAALQAFRDEHYGRCIEKMDILRKNNPADVNALFYTGVCYVKLEMFSKAIPLLDDVLNSTNNVFSEEAQWYKALALAGNGDKDAAKKILDDIVVQNGFYADQAKEMLKKI